MKIVSSIQRTTLLFKDHFPPRWVPIGFLNSSFWVLIMLFSTVDPEYLDHLERLHFQNPHANNSGFMHSPQMTFIAGGVSILSLVSSIFMTTRSVKELKKVGNSFHLVNWRSNTLVFSNLSKTDNGWPSKVPMGLRTWDVVIQGNGKKYLVNTRKSNGDFTF